MTTTTDSQSTSTLDQSRSSAPLVYFAGKVEHPSIDYRAKLTGHPDPMKLEPGTIIDLPPNGGTIRYGGPNAIWDLPSYAGSVTHGLSYEECWSGGDFDSSVAWLEAEGGHNRGLEQGDVVKRCMTQIAAADHVHAFIQCTTCYGTMVELGIAAALCKPISIVFSTVMAHRFVPNGDRAWANSNPKDLWFAAHLPTVKHVLVGGPSTYRTSGWPGSIFHGSKT